MQQYARFVRTSLRYQFGETVEKVVDALLVRGGQPLEPIAAYAKLTADDAGRALMVLIQHDIVQTTNEAVPLSTRKPKTPAAAPAAAAAAAASTTPGAAAGAAAGAGTGASAGAVAAKPAAASKLGAAAPSSSSSSSSSSTTNGAAKTAEKAPVKAQPAAAAAPASAAAGKGAATAGAATGTETDKAPAAPVEMGSRTVYHLDIEVVRCRPRFARYCIQMKEQFGREGELIADTFCTRGKITQKQLFAQCIARVGRPAAAAAAAAVAEDPALGDGDPLAASSSSSSGSGKAAAVTEKTLKSVFHMMLSANYLKRADTVASAAVKVALKKRKVDELVEQHTERPTKANLAKKKARLSTNAADFNFGDGEDDAKAGGPAKTAAAGDIDAAEATVFYTWNHEQFTFDAKRDIIAEYVTRKVDPAAALIVRAMMGTYHTDPNRPNPYLDLERIMTELSKHKKGAELSEDAVLTCLEELCLEQPAICARRSGVAHAGTNVGDTYVVQTHKVFAHLKQQHACAIAREKTDVLGGRIFALLNTHKRLEEKQIAEFAIAPKKKIREVLYSLLRAKFVSLQEIPRAADRNPQKSFFCWGVPNDKVLEMLLESFLFSWCNVRMRLECEEAAIRPLQQRIHIREQITAADKTRWDQWSIAADRLENALSRLNTLILLFKDC